MRPRGPHPLPLFLALVQREVGEDFARLRRILGAVERYQAGATRLPECSGHIVYRIGNAALRRYPAASSDKDAPTKPPVLFVPSLVNPPSILDFGDRSLLRYLSGRGYNAYLLDWGEPGEAETQFDLGDHIRRIEAFAATLERPVLAGYCLGGTLAIAAAARGDCALSGLATIAAPWDFGGYPDRRRSELLDYWEGISASVDALGKVPMDLVQPAFWALDPALPAAKFERYAAMPAGSEAALSFERLEDWANNGPAIPLPAMCEAIVDLFGANLSGRGEWSVGGEARDPARIAVPWIDVRSASDRIVPAEAGPPAPDVRTVASGHVGMMIGSRAESSLWQPLAKWLDAM